MAGARAERARSRYPAIDVMRGLALVSMISSHVAGFRIPSVIGRSLHSAHWIDGAFFFVALSGIVTGLVHRRLVERSGWLPSARKLLRRAWFLYAVHIALAVTIMVVHGMDAASAAETPTWRQAGGLGPASRDIALLRLEPDYNTVLPMYVALLLWAVVAVALLRRRRWWAVVAISTSVYVFSQTVDGLALTRGAFEIGGWQLLFTAGLLVGWTWEHERRSVGEGARRALVIAAGTVVVALYVAARAAQRPMERIFGGALTKGNGGWLAFVFAGAAMVTGYVVIDRARRLPAAARVMRPVEIIGSKGLPGYVAMVLCLLVIGDVHWLGRGDLAVVAIAGVCLATEYVAVRLGRRRARLGDRAAAAVVSTGDQEGPARREEEEFTGCRSCVRAESLS
jgi:hypothetical protein